MKTHYVLAPFLTIVICFPILAQTVQFKVPITIQSGSYRDTLWIGVSGDGTGGKIVDNTYGPDVEKTYGSSGQWRELMHPPDFPTIKFNAKFVDIPGHKEIGATGLKPYDFRGFTSFSQIDSFAIRVYGDSVAKGALTLSWPKNLDSFGNLWQLLKKEGKKYTVVVSNMISSRSYTDPNTASDERLDYLLIKSGVKKK